ncbi:nucleoside triphosphate pyrophosphohydrolase family protein [Clostridium senegalense]|uniref:hypothetical protein n=1 Tax=Clostridium senegalense TaxID=1465809 RepID=UPI00028957C1|nr:hypothetical protein [Clostridium senegalense]MBU5226953.1 DUF1573 domain-containing protein [Clostridium senegalense]
MKDLIFDEFQNSVDDCLLRHRSILDIMSKLDESQSRVNRSIVKCITSCGCLQIEASKQKVPNDFDTSDFDSFKSCFDTHVKGQLCDNCREIIEKELGNHFFYIASLCNCTNLNIYDILLKEYKNMVSLGKYTLK